MQGKGSSATLGEMIAAKRYAGMRNEDGRVSEIEAEAQNTRLLLVAR